MTNMDTPLLKSLAFRSGVEAKNRLWLAPLTNTQALPGGHLSDDELEWLRARAAGGYGVITSCSTHVSEFGDSFPGQWGSFSDAHTAGWARAAAAVHEHGALLFGQLQHGGFRAIRGEGRPVPISASDGEGPDGPYRAATSDEVWQLVQDFADAAKRLADAGADGVEIHAGHRYVICQFMGALSNTREDEWGGSLEARGRFLVEIIKAIRAVTPPKFVIGIRVSPEDRFGEPLGLYVEESVAHSQMAVDAGADFVHVSLWDIRNMRLDDPERHPLAAFREELPADIPLVIAGIIWDREDADLGMSLGADAVAFGRAAIINPDIPKNIYDPAWQPTRPPVTVQYLKDVSLGPAFIKYMRRWDGFIAD